MYMEDEEILKDLKESRGLSTKTMHTYKLAINTYTNFFGCSLQQLLDEAEKEEEQGIRWKHRKLRKRLLEYRNYLAEKYLKSTAKKLFSQTITIYVHYDIEIHRLPSWNEKSLNTNAPVTYADLPDRGIIKEAVNMSDNLMKAIILFMSSSGTARREVLNLSLNDFLLATEQYHNSNNIEEVIAELDGKDDIIPLFKLKRQKTNKYYYTFCSPEAVQAIINYLKSRDNLNKGKYGNKLFKINARYLNERFRYLNEKMNLGKIGAHSRFRSHMLRKFHASQLYNNGMTLEMVDALQGRSKDSTHSSYFMEDPEKLKQEYVNHLDCLMVNWNGITYKSPEFLELEKENKDKDDKIKDYEAIFNEWDDTMKKVEEKGRILDDNLDRLKDLGLL